MIMRTMEARHEDGSGMILTMPPGRAFDVIRDWFEATCPEGSRVTVTEPIETDLTEMQLAVETDNPATSLIVLGYANDRIQQIIDDVKAGIL